ncbi:hypothetical protein [Frigidibacter sp. MR17.24]|uniref:hypothetical protein n=1 Tax=Frigidibacter sp. MR17.24 TaxID=3127345 RepID=UPI003012EFF3
MKVLLASVIMICATAIPAFAETVLTVITPEGKTELDWAALDALPATTVKTTNDYVDGIHTFTGPRLSEIFGEGKVKEGDEIRLTALNDYAVTLPADDALDYAVILATTQDGKRMSVRDKGPIWVIYPMSEHPDLRAPVYNDRLIWQLSKAELVPAK